MFINENINGRTIESVMTDGNRLVIRTTDSHEFRIAWKNDDGTVTKGEPILEGIDVRIIMQKPFVQSQ